jgi:hypothetical protein
MVRWLHMTSIVIAAADGGGLALDIIANHATEIRKIGQRALCVAIAVAAQRGLGRHKRYSGKAGFVMMPRVPACDLPSPARTSSRVR